MHIYIDQREHALKSLTPVNNYDNNEQSQVSYKNLHIGDVQIVDESTGTNIVILERKTFADLRSSLTDGRFSEQKRRICSSDFIHKGYILEGHMPSVDPSFQNIIRQIIIRVQFKDKMCVFLTGSVQDTQLLIHEIHRKLQIDSKLYMPQMGGAQRAQSDYTESLHVCKKLNLTPKRCYILQLSQIPGISKVSAQVIAEHYPNWGSLTAGLEERDIFLENTKTAKIGPKKYTQLYTYVKSGLTD